MSAAPTGPTPSEIAQFELRDATWKRQQVDGFVIRVRPTDCKYLPVQRLGMGKTMQTFQADVQKKVDAALQAVAGAPAEQPLALAERTQGAQRKRSATDFHEPPPTSTGRWEATLGVAHSTRQYDDPEAWARRAAEKLNIERVMARARAAEPRRVRRLKHAALERSRDGSSSTAERPYLRRLRERVAAREATFLAKYPWLLCGCSTPGICFVEPAEVSALIREAHPAHAHVEYCDAAPPNGRSGGVGAYYLPGGHLDKELTDLVEEYLEHLCHLDELIVFSNGQNGELVLLSETEHKRPERRHFGACMRRRGESQEQLAARLDVELEWPDGNKCATSGADAMRFAALRHGADSIAPLVSYRNNTCGMPAFFVGSHLPPIVFEMALEAWNAVRPVLDPVSQLRPPDSIIPTFYQGEETIVMHSDSRPSERGKRVEQRRGTSVMAISFGDDMDFWARKFIRGSGDKKETGPDFFVKRMGHLSVFVWRFRADHAWEHSPRFEKFPPGECWDRARTAIICRWIDAVRWYETEKPYFTCCGGDAWLRPETRGAKCGCSRCEE